jgi:hypothetical protein
MPKVLKFHNASTTPTKQLRQNVVADTGALTTLMDVDALACANDILAMNRGLTGREFVSYLMRDFWQAQVDITPRNLRAEIAVAKRNAAEWAG